MNITSPRQLIHSIPGLVGAIAPDSLVVVELGDGQVRSHVTISFSVDEESHGLEQAVKALTCRDDSALVAIAFSQDADLASETLERVQVLAESHNVHVLDLLHVFGSRWRSVICQDDSCCPEIGNAIDEDSREGFSSNAQTNQPSVEELQLQTRTLTKRELELRDEAFANVGSWPSGNPVELFEYRNDKVNAAMEMLTHQPEDVWAVLASVGSVLLDIRSRDGILRRVLENKHDRRMISHNLVTLFCVAPIQYRAAIATVLAGASWLDGDQATTRHAIDVALEEDPEYSLARLLDTALIHGVPHRVWVDSLTAVAYDKCLAGAA